MSPAFTAKLTHVLTLCIAVVFVLLPFHAFLTVWLASSIGHYTLLRLWKELILVLVGLVALGLLIRDKALQRSLKQSRLVLLIAIYIALEIFLGFTATAHHQVSGKALAYGLLDDSRYLLFCVLCAGIAARDDWLKRHWRPLVLVPAILVLLFGLLQATVLPHDVLRHFGYSLQTIPVMETVNSNAHYLRVQSTLRGANPLGAYLIVILALFTVLCIRAKEVRSRMAYALGVLASLFVLYFSYSRSAEIGAILSLGCIGFTAVKHGRARKQLLVVLAVILLLAGSGAWMLRHNVHFENVFFHTSPHSVAVSSDQNHDTALKDGLHDVLHDPLGRGPGTAGPASVYNHDRPARDPENYFIQITQEFGWLGVVLFVAICVIVGMMLWRMRADNLSLALFASLIGLSFVGLFSQVWTDDTLSYLWWGLAGIAIAPVFMLSPKLSTGKKHAKI